MAKTKNLNPEDFYTADYGQYISAVQKLKSGVAKVLIVEDSTTDEAAIAAVEKVLSGKDESGVKFNAQLLKMVVKKGVKPTVKRVYHNVLMTLFKTRSVEYDYGYYLNGDHINMSPKKININEGYAEFFSSSQCYEGTSSYGYNLSYPWDKLADEHIRETPSDGYLFSVLTQSDLDKDSKESMKQYNEQLKDWLEKFQQESLGKARTISGVNVYDKDYDYNEMILLVPFIMVSYDLGDSIITFPVCAFTGKVESVLLNNPLARFETDDSALPPNFSIVIFLLASFVFIIVGGVFYLLNYMKKKAMFKSKSLKEYSVADLRKLI